MNPNPFLSLNYEPAIAHLGDEYYDEVEAAQFPQHILRFRNDQLLAKLGLEPREVTNTDFIEAFGKFESVNPFLALRYHGYQFGQYNPNLGDGRGFLYGQVRGVDGKLYDFGTKGSGTTPYSRGGDGRLTLKGGVREVIASEALHQLGVNTSRTFCLIETGESLWRGDEPSPTRSSVMIRFSHSHIRFGTFERLHAIKRPDLISKLLDHVIAIYYPEVEGESDYGQFYAQLVKRVARLTAQWMAAGFCHGVLNTDNMSITGESFDYGPYAFIPTYDPYFTAAYFDYSGLYCYANQPFICRLNLERLQVPLRMVMHQGDLDAGLAQFDDEYLSHYSQLMLQKLGFDRDLALGEELLVETLQWMRDSEIGYHEFFAELAQWFTPSWQQASSIILENASFAAKVSESWKQLYHQALNQISSEAIETMGDRLKLSNPKTVPLRPIIESVWQPITEEDDWQPFNDLLEKIKYKQ